ncbi:MAG: MBL fold metallo-hydrolase [Thermoprotei archaeon]|nr:MAG: MBL fold metallo-hydrolase [Thermoprotei archaeon]
MEVASVAVEWCKIGVVLDNVALREGLESDWGLSVYLETPYSRALFDTGIDPGKLRRNSKRLGIDLSSLNGVVISHAHWDHVGGLSAVAELSPGLRVYVPSHAELEDYVARLGLTPVPVHETAELLKGVYVVGEQPSRWGLWEQALAIKVGYELIVLCGCSHPGVDKIASKALRDLGGSLRAVIGGLHNPSLKAIERLLELGVKKVYPLHCSGSRVRDYLRRYPGKLGEGGGGLELCFTRLL